MQITAQKLDGVFLITPDLHTDTRGFFARSFCEGEFAAAGLHQHYPQHNISFNHKAGTVRGMHYQRPPHEEVKVVRCVAGAILDVVVDLRPGSPTLHQSIAVELSAANHLALYIPTGFAHGFQTLADNTEVHYLMGAPFVPGSGAGLRWDDPALDVSWPLEITMISEQDRSWPDLAQ